MDRNARLYFIRLVRALKKFETISYIRKAKMLKLPLDRDTRLSVIRLVRALNKFEILIISILIQPLIQNKTEKKK